MIAFLLFPPLQHGMSALVVPQARIWQENQRLSDRWALRACSRKSEASCPPTRRRWRSQTESVRGKEAATKVSLRAWFTHATSSTDYHPTSIASSIHHTHLACHEQGSEDRAIDKMLHPLQHFLTRHLSSFFFTTTITSHARQRLGFSGSARRTTS